MYIPAEFGSRADSEIFSRFFIRSLTGSIRRPGITEPPNRFGNYTSRKTPVSDRMRPTCKIARRMSSLNISGCKTGRLFL